MIDHVKSHLRKEPGPTVACRHPVYEVIRLVPKTVDEFKLHVKEVYSVTLRDL